MHKLTMVERLTFLTKKAVAHKSNFLVASIIVDKDGVEHQGVNIEYEIPTNSLCAERNAITTAFTSGVRLGDIREVHVLAKNLNIDQPDLIVTPCGACRQAILEASAGKAVVHMYSLNGEVDTKTIEQLLPGAFHGVDR